MRFHADPHDLPNQANDVAEIVFAIWVGIAFDLVLVDNPVERGAGAEAIVEGLGRDSRNSQRLVHPERLLVG